MKNLAGLILAAGKGRRLGSFYGNKVLAPLLGKPIISYGVKILKDLGLPVYVVVGYGQEQVKKVLGKTVSYVEQKEQLGTGHAVSCSLPSIDSVNEHVFVLMGDHCFALTSKFLERLFDLHKNEKSDITVVSVLSGNINGYGRLIRDKKNKIIKIIDGKNDVDRIEKTGEITPGIYCFKLSFLKEFLPKLKRDKISGEYFLSDLVNMANVNNKKVSCLVTNDEKLTIGINTAGDLKKIETLLCKN